MIGIRRRLALSLVMFLGGAAALAAVTVSGRTAGQFQVGESGEATYTVPISIAAGTGGIEPKLALSYNSQGSNSLLGVGWSLAGFSVISRCPATPAQDATLDPVDFDSNDRFCLDGERLMAIAGVYGANATEYRTEQDSFRRIFSLGQAGSGPASFTVETKSGLIYEYGNTADSRIEAQGKTSALFWAVNRIADTKGNYLTVTYTEDPGEFRPSRIDYTANDEASLTLYAKVEFEYETRPDAIPHFIAGSLLKTTQRLRTVKAYDVPQIYREYRLAYEQSEATGQSRLTSITECGSNGDCFGPTNFGWQTWAVTDFNFTGAGSGNWAGHGGGATNNFVGDFNGDGKSDIMGYAFTPAGQWHVVLSTGTGFDLGGGFWNGPTGGPTNVFLADFNGDGRTDATSYLSAGVWQVALSDGASFSASGSGNWNGHSFGAANNFLGDFNGDGRTDLMGFTGTLGQWQVGLSTGSNFNAAGSGTWRGHRGRAEDNFIGDFNGDGRSDSLGYTGVAGLWAVALSDGTGFEGTGSGNWNGHSGNRTNNFLGDFNGDGKTDIMAYAGSQNHWQVALSSGTNFNAPGSGTWGAHYGGAANNVLGDFNGDGKTDIAGYNGAGGQWSVCLSTGTSFSCRNWIGHSAGTSNNFLGDFDGDGKTDLMRYSTSFGMWQVALSAGPAPDLLKSVTDAHSVTTVVDYAPLTDSAVYTKSSGAVYPEQDFQGAIYVVAGYTTSDGIGGVYPFSSHYAGAKVDLRGRGFRGFASATATDDNIGLSTTTFYERDFRCVNAKILRTEQRQEDGTLISEIDNTIEIQDHGFGVHFSFVGESEAHGYELDGSLVSVVGTASDYDQNGNVTRLEIDYGDGLMEVTVNSYDDDVDRWFLGRLVRTEVTKTAPGQPTRTRTSAFAYDSESGLLTSETIEPDQATLRLTKVYQYDVYGNITVSTLSGPGITTRSQSSGYSDRGRYVLVSTNALNQVETRSYSLGNLRRVTGPNQLTTNWEYDGFGRQTRELRADGTETLTSYLACNGECPAGAVYYVSTESTGAPPTVSYLDLLDRVIRKETAGFNGTPIYVDTKYNQRGFAKWTSEPYFTGAVPLWTELRFDPLGRVTTEIAPGTRTTITAYAGRTTTVTNPLGQRQVRRVDARGQLVESIDNLGGSLLYSYDAFGNLVELEDPLGNQTTFTYDLRGNRISIDDPDTGVSTFVYDTLGQLTSQTDAKHNTVSLAYDSLGRLIRRTEPEGTSTWTYDTRDHGIGKLATVSRVDFAESYFYDALGRLEETRTTIAGEVFSIRAGYDLIGRPEILIYPSGYGVRTLYNSLGYAEELRRTSDNQPLWVAEALNARGQLERSTLGNGLAVTRDFDPDTGRLDRIRTGAVQDLNFDFDAVGNLAGRSDTLRGLAEVFAYDGLNRLTASQVIGRSAVGVDYDELGNIVSKSDVGVYTYGQNGAGPHAVTSIAGQRGGTYSYDANGNLIGRQRLNPAGLIFADGFESGNTAAWNQAAPAPALPATTIAYTSFNKPRSIQEGTNTLTFSYGPDYSRYRQVVTSPAGTTTKRYVGGIFERETMGATTRDTHFVPAGGEIVAVYTAEHTGAATLQKTRYLHHDHLGSVQTITNESGAMVEVLSFDPWGLRRNALDWTAAAAPITSSIDRGFTFHEHLDEVSLIHMNGRVYDPVIGRFLSADPFVQAPEFTQSLNRYSYVINNPLSLTDSTGYLFGGILRFFGRIFRSTIGRFAVSVVVGYLTVGLGNSLFGFLLPGSQLALTIGSGAGFGFGSALSGALISGRSILDAIQAGFLSAFTGGLSGGNGYLFGGAKFGFNLSYLKEVIAHGVTQGVARTASGGRFEHGFISGLFSRAFSPLREEMLRQDPVLGTLAASVLGGTAAELGGGKFANGAVTTAFITGFTRLALEMRQRAIAQSRLADGNHSQGYSNGFRGDGEKQAGGRVDPDPLHSTDVSALGGHQGGPGSFLWIFSYGPGDPLDRLLEAYAGPHDELNRWYMYDSMGRIDPGVHASFASELFGTGLNVTNVLIATPLAVSSMVPDHEIQGAANYF